MLNKPIISIIVSVPIVVFAASRFGAYRPIAFHKAIDAPATLEITESDTLLPARFQELQGMDYIIFREVHDFREYRDGVRKILPELDALGFKRFCFELIPTRYESDINEFLKTGKMTAGLQKLLFMLVTQYGIKKEAGATLDDNSYVRLFKELRKLGWTIHGIYYSGNNEMSMEEHVTVSDRIYTLRLEDNGGVKSVLLIGRSHNVKELVNNSTDVLLWNNNCEENLTPSDEHSLSVWEYEATYQLFGKNPGPGLYKLTPIGTHSADYVLIVS